MDSRTPVIRQDDGELLGYVGKERSAFTAQTIFGYVLARTESQNDAEMVVRSEGLKVLKGIWRYYDSDDHDWFACTLRDAFENKVIIIRTNELGYQDSKTHKIVTIENPDETVLQRA